MSKDNEIFRHSAEYGIWRTNVFQRDNYTCQECGKKGVKLNAHHINTFSNFPEDRLKLDNGITLCEECHKNTSTYGQHKVIA